MYLKTYLIVDAITINSTILFVVPVTSQLKDPVPRQLKVGDSILLVSNAMFADALSRTFIICMNDVFIVKPIFNNYKNNAMSELKKGELNLDAFDPFYLLSFFL
ncbi:unnamed protein product [Absidia cylindrospora]